MATYKGIEQQLNKAEVEYGKVVEKLNDWEKEWGERFTKLRKGDAEIYVGEMEELRKVGGEQSSVGEAGGGVGKEAT